MNRPGYDALWQWFCLDRSSWLTMPRIMLHEMPDDWQAKMAELLHEWDDTWNSDNMPTPYVTARAGNKFTRWPDWLLNYRRPDMNEIKKLRKEAMQ